MKRFWIGIFIGAVSFPLLAALRPIGLPVIYDNQDMGHATVNTDGMTVVNVDTTSLVELLDGQISEENIALLQGQNTWTFDELKALGIDMSFNQQTWSLDLNLSSEVLAQSRLGLNPDTPTVFYSPSTDWSWQNSFNFNYNDSGLEQIESEYNLDLQGAFNVGGFDGVNGAYQVVFANEFGESDIYKGRTYLFMDNVNRPWRYQLGDLDPINAGHLPGISLAGLSWFRAYDEIQPYRQLRNAGTQPIELTESAVVTVFVNGIRVTQLRLRPGRYELDDLPLTDGANEIELDIQYASGERERLTYSQFYNARLLEAGVSDFGLSVGVEGQQALSGIEYGDTVYLSGFYDYGLSESWTVGASILGNEFAQVGGVTITNGSDFGNVSFRASLSQHEIASGNALSLDYSRTVWGASEQGSPNFQFSIEQYTDFAVQLEEQTNLQSFTTARLSYQWYISEQWDASVFANYQKQNDISTVNGNAQLSWQNERWRVSVGSSYSEDDLGETQNEIYFSVDFTFDVFRRTQFEAGYNSEFELAQVALYRDLESFSGDYGYAVIAQDEPDQQSLLARGEYNANRWRGLVEAEQIKETDGESRTRTFANASTTLIASSDGVAMGRPQVGTNAIVKVHPSLQGKDVYVNEFAPEQAEAIATSSLSNIVPLTRPHQLNEVTYKVPDAPIGYSLGSGIEKITPGSLTVSTIVVGSDETYTLVGYAVNEQGEAIALKAAQLIKPDGTKQTIFTNGKGRFVIDGLSLGQYRIEFKDAQAQFDIDEGEGALRKLGNLTFTVKEEQQ